MNLLSSKNISKIFISILFILFVIFSADIMLHGNISFDGAMNMQVPLNLIESGSYATNYDGIKYFDSRIQTGVPFLLTSLFFIKVFGYSALSAQMSNFLFMIALAVIIL